MIISARNRRKRNVIVWLNGQDITNRCFWLNTKTGEARCYKLDAEGRKHLTWPEHGAPYVARESLHGKIVVWRRATR